MDASSTTNIPPLRTVVEAGFVVFRKNMPRGNVEYLVLQSATGCQTWGPPKGHWEEGESNDQTAWRELKEETGLGEKQIKVLEDFKHVVKYTKDDKKYKEGTNSFRKKMLIVHLWLAELMDPNYKIEISTEHRDYKWLPLNDTKQLLRTRGGSDQYIEYFEKCEQRIQKLN